MLDARPISLAVLARCGMVQVPEDFLLGNRTARRLIHLIARDAETGQVVGTVTGVDHVRAFNDPEGGSSLWCLAVDCEENRATIAEEGGIVPLITLARDAQGVYAPVWP